jgi:hypothetical protein
VLTERLRKLSAPDDERARLAELRALYERVLVSSRIEGFKGSEKLDDDTRARLLEEVKADIRARLEDIKAIERDLDAPRPFVFPEEREPDVRVSTTDAQLIFARSRAQAVHWGFGAFIATVALGVIAFVVLAAERIDTNGLREMVMTLGTGEIGLISGLLASRER